MYRQALIGEVPRAEVIAVVGAVARLGLREELERRATLGLRFADREMDVEAILRPLTLNVIGVGNGLLPRQRILRRRSFHRAHIAGRSEEHTSELQSLMRISYAVFCLKKKTKKTN